MSASATTRPLPEIIADAVAATAGQQTCPLTLARSFFMTLPSVTTPAWYLWWRAGPLDCWHRDVPCRTQAEALQLQADFLADLRRRGLPAPADCFVTTCAEPDYDDLAIWGAPPLADPVLALNRYRP
jgi:hypothetical protein